MRRIRIFALCVWAALVLLLPVRAAEPPANDAAASLAVPSVSGPLQVRGPTLCDAAGNAVQLRGVSTHGLAWFPEYVNEACFRQLRENWNVNAVRLALYTEESGGYCSGGDRNALKSLIDKGVSCAVAQDLYIIIDWHILSDGNPNRHLEDAKAFFQEMSAKYAGCPNVLYEICNEPNGGVSWNEIKRYAEAVTGVIRANAKDAVVLVGTPNWSQFVDQAAANPITAYDNLMYTLHFYAATHTDQLRKTMVSAIEQGLPVFVSEYGICDASGNGAINTVQADQWVRTMDRCGVSYIAWNLSNKAETSAILRSSCQKTSGFTENDLSASGKWLYEMLTAGKRTPARVPPGETVLGKNAPSVSSPEMGISCTAVLQNQWQSDGEFFYQYTLSIRNSGKTNCDSWRVQAAFSGPAVLQNGWNGNYSAAGTVLRITAKDYNRSIPPGGTAENIGWIVKGGQDLKLLNCAGF
ncbi:MAG: cellulase family glycosylhydrolase [Oscillibacter sp.]|jgi:endoglucanase|nr:cellulase family glycosylhydrolase [Oscillibacter sp.]MCI9481371.1 cellulase family glycosylhydrolase [Oscillibacter sp.]